MASFTKIKIANKLFAETKESVTIVISRNVNNKYSIKMVSSKKISNSKNISDLFPQFLSLVHKKYLCFAIKYKPFYNFINTMLKYTFLTGIHKKNNWIWDILVPWVNSLEVVFHCSESFDISWDMSNLIRKHWSWGQCG